MAQLHTDVIIFSDLIKSSARHENQIRSQIKDQPPTTFATELTEVDER